MAIYELYSLPLSDTAQQTPMQNYVLDKYVSIVHNIIWKVPLWHLEA